MLNLFYNFLQTCLGHKNNIYYNKGRITYELLTRQKLKKPKQQNTDLEIEF